MRTLLAAAAVVGIAIAAPQAAQATILSPWGSDLAATPTLTTAGPGISPYPHDGADFAAWNTAATDGANAPAGGQVLQINIKGCAIEDTSAPSQYSQGVAVNTINFVAITPEGGTSYKTDSVAPAFQLPFCSNSSSPATGAVNTSTVSSFEPLHLCVSQGDTVAFEDIGGFIPAQGGQGPWYPSGTPFDVIAPVSGSSLDSLTDAEGQTTYTANGTERGDELLMQMIEGTGDDAYGLCPGGNAVEPTNSNTVICVTRSASPEGYPSCNSAGQPVYPPANSAPPTISGTAEQGQRLVETHGSWSNNPWYRDQWEDCDTSGANCQPIAGATYQYYYPTASDVGHTLEVEEWAINDANTVGPVSTAPTAVVMASPSPPPGVSGPPAIKDVVLNPASFNAARGTTITYMDSQRATATLRVIALLPGVMRGGTCAVAPKHKARSARACTRTLPVISLTHKDRAGSNGVKLTGVKPGRYELQVSATLAGKTSAVVAAPFTARLVHSKRHAPRSHGK